MFTLKIPSAADIPAYNELMKKAGLTEREQAGVPAEETQTWMRHWIDREPQRFLALITDETGKAVGAAGWRSEGGDAFVRVAPEHHTSGAGLDGFSLVVARAFRHLSIDCLRAHADADSDENLPVYLAEGFAPVFRDEGKLLLRLTRERFETLRREKWLRAVTDAMCTHDAGDPKRIQHFLKVHAYARQIALAEGVDANTRFTLEIAALCHDIGSRAAESRFGYENAALQQELGPAEGETILSVLGLPAPVIRRVSFLIAHHHVTDSVAGIDWRILLEADFLVNMIEKDLPEDAIRAGAESIFRTDEGKLLLTLTIPDRAKTWKKETVTGMTETHTETQSVRDVRETSETRTDA